MVAVLPGSSNWQTEQTTAEGWEANAEQTKKQVEDKPKFADDELTT